MPDARINEFARLAGLADLPYRPPPATPTRSDWMAAARPITLAFSYPLGDKDVVGTVQLKPEVTAAGECRWVGTCRVTAELGEARPVVNGRVEFVMAGSKKWEE